MHRRMATLQFEWSNEGRYTNRNLRLNMAEKDAVQQDPRLEYFDICLCVSSAGSLLVAEPADEDEHDQHERKRGTHVLHQRQGLLGTLNACGTANVG